LRNLRYDPSVLRETAARLDAVATTTVVVWTAVGVGVGAGVFSVVGLAFDNPVLGALVGLVVGGVIGYLVGEHRVLMLRLEVQLALCHVAIEENTRVQTPDGATAGVPSGSGANSRSRHAPTVGAKADTEHDTVPASFIGPPSSGPATGDIPPSEFFYSHGSPEEQIDRMARRLRR